MNPFRAALRFHRLRTLWLGSGGHPVPSHQSQSRASVCLGCSLNKPQGIREFFTEAAALTLTRQIELKSGMQLSVVGEEDLHICDACSCYLPLKAHAPIEHILATTDLSELPAWCWILAEKAVLPTT